MELATDNLNLNEINVAAVPHDILFPDELNQHLKGQLEFLMHTNGMLQRQVSEKEVQLKDKSVQITDLNKKINELEQFTKFTDTQYTGNSTHLMGAKIIELSKKLKDKIVETESLKTKNSKLQQKLSNLQNQLPKEEPELTDTFTEQTETEKKSDSNEDIKLLQEKLSQTNNKLFDVKNQNIKLKNELKSAHKILQQEIGDSFGSIQNISSNSNWRGRAQQILHLQQKVSELQEKIMTLSDKESSITVPKVDTRKQIIELLQKDLSIIKNELEDTRKKLNGARARVKVLENESNSARTKVISMETKALQDEKMIIVLTNQVASLEERNNHNRKEKNFTSVKLEEENKRLKQDLSTEKIVIEDLKKIIDEKDKKILEIENTSKPVQNQAVSSPKTISATDLSKMKILEVEVNRLLELLSVLNKRLDEERVAHNTTQLNYKKERQRAAKLELKLSRLELETSLNNNKLNSYSRSSLKLNEDENNRVINIETLKNSLELAEESVAILRTQLDILRKEKDLDYQRFSTILTETSSMLLKCNNSYID